MKARYVIKFIGKNEYWYGEWFDCNKKSIQAVEYETSCIMDALTHAETYFIEYGE